jgi:glycine/D-amino acid oxidase-like deaminating enzyme
LSAERIAYDRSRMLTAEPKGYGSNWYATTRVDGPVRPRLSMELDVDVCVIGGGLAGLTVACEVARLGWSVVVVEAKSVAWSASGRGSGVVLPGFSASVDSLIERVGLDTAKTLWAMSEAGAEYVRNAARDMPGVSLNEEGWLHVSKTDRAGVLAHEAAVMAGEFGVAVEPWPADRVRAALNSPRYFHGLHYPRGFSLHPLNYALGLAAAAEASGARIFEDTPVLEIDPAGVRKRVVTSDSRIRAAHIVLAGGAHMNELAPQFAETLLPIFDSAVITAPLGEELAETIRYPGAVSDEIDAGHHYRVVDGRRLMWCGQSAVRLGNPHRQGEALLRQIRHTYPALSGVRAEHAWVGVAGRTVHGMPQIGEVTPGLWLLNGFGGHGLNTTAMAGELVARAIVQGDRAWEMFSAFPLVWAGGRFGRFAQQIAGWSRQLRESIGGMLAQRHGAVRSRPEPVVAAEAAATSPEPLLEPLPAAAEPEPLMPPTFIEPVEPSPPEAQPEFTRPAEPTPTKPVVEPVRAPVTHPEIVERIRALVGRPKVPAAGTEAAAPAADGQIPAIVQKMTDETSVAAAEASPIPAEPIAPIEPPPIPVAAVARVESMPLPAEAAVPVLRKRPKRGPKKRKAPRLLELAAQTAEGSAAADATTPPAPPEGTDQTPAPVVDKKL